MFRDPRDVVVSGYFSAVGGHRKTPYEDFRNRLRAMPVEEGIAEVIAASETRLLEIASWVDVEDPNVATFKLEEVALDPRGSTVAMLAHCGVTLDPAELDALLAATSREALQEKDLAERTEGEESHYRVDRKGYLDLFTPEHHAALEKLIPGVVARLGYPD